MTSPDFLQWCYANGVRARGIASAYVSDGWRGIIAERHIISNEVILEVPESLLISARSARADAVLGPLLLKHPHLDSYQVQSKRVSITLLCNRDNSHSG